MDKKIKLNLGCGPVYKPGYINIDQFDNIVADEICNVSDLPFKPNSVDLIEANQLIEHFDYIHCKYILSEWFRILKPGGVLILETPDLKKTLGKFTTDLKTQKTTLQWIYGIDSPGMQHKTGFTFDLLRGLLLETGFENVSKEEPKTHRYEPGMRTVCEKPKNCPGKQFLACFRGRIKSKLETDDSYNSYILIPLEKWLGELSVSCEQIVKNEGGRTCEIIAEIDEIISKTVICTPLIPLAFLEEFINFGLADDPEIRDKIEPRIEVLDYLAETEFHKRIFSLWIKSKKGAGGVRGEFEDFASRLGFLMSDILNEPTGYRERLGYITDLKPGDIEIFDFYLVLLKARELFNVGVKYFHMGEFPGAMDFFLKSSRINPDNPFVYWNMARLGSILKLEMHSIIDNYEKAMNLMKDKETLEMIRGEFEHVSNKTRLIEKEPVCSSEDI